MSTTPIAPLKMTLDEATDLADCTILDGYEIDLMRYISGERIVFECGEDTVATLPKDLPLEIDGDGKAVLENPKTGYSHDFTFKVYRPLNSQTKEQS